MFRLFCQYKCLSVVTCVWFLTILSGCVPTQTGRSAHHVKTKAQLQGTESYYAGYSKEYVPYRDKLAAGDVTAVQKMMDDKEQIIRESTDSEEALAEELRLVGLMERASLSLQMGDVDRALIYCKMGKDLLEERASESYMSEGVSNVGSFFGDFLGVGQFARYSAPGYEQVMLLNMYSMAYLLNGDDRAFNVARLAIQWQDDEKEKFALELGEVKEEKTEQNDAQAKHSKGKLTRALSDEFSKYDSMALKVPNAFVNPFGDYVTGMINEFKSIKVKSLLSNANIAYKQALKLNPKSKVLQQAVKDTKKKKSASRLIHIVALDGFVPEKKVLSIPIDRDVDVELPTYNKIQSKVATIKVMTTSGKVLATLSPVADLNALAMRHQKDSLPYIQAMLLSSVIRDTLIVGVGDGLIGGLGGLVRKVVDDGMEPDTTSWLTLPSTVLAARIYAPKGLRKLKIRSYDKKGKQIAQKTVKLGKGSRHFVLVRSIDKTMYAYPSKKIWSPKS